MKVGFASLAGLFVVSFAVTVSGARFVAEDFQISTKNSNGTTTNVHGVRLRDSQTGQLTESIWDCGGRLERVYLLSKQSPKLLRDVIQTHHGNATAIRTNPHYDGAVLAPWANRIANGTYVFRNETHYLPRNEENAYRSDALHGFLVGREMTVLARKEEDTYSSVTYGISFENTTYPGWPFSIDLELTYFLELESADFARVRVELVVQSKEESLPLPFFAGQHPYFLVSDVSKARLELDNCSRWGHVEMPPGAPEGGSLIPTGRTTMWTKFNGKNPIGGNSTTPTYLDDEFVALDAPLCPNLVFAIIDPVANERSELVGAAPNVKTFHVFTGGKSRWGWNAVAMEPMTAMADAYNNHRGLSILSADELWTTSWIIRTARI